MNTLMVNTVGITPLEIRSDAMFHFQKQRDSYNIMRSYQKCRYIGEDLNKIFSTSVLIKYTQIKHLYNVWGMVVHQT